MPLQAVCPHAATAVIAGSGDPAYKAPPSLWPWCLCGQFPAKNRFFKAAKASESFRKSFKVYARGGCAPRQITAIFGLATTENGLNLRGKKQQNLESIAKIEWLSDMDSNHDKGLQRALCYHYTIGQSGLKLDFLRRPRKAKIARPAILMRKNVCPRLC